MTYRELSNIALKIMGIYLLVQAIPNLIHGIMMPFTDLRNIQGINWTVEIINWIIVGIFYAVTGYLLIFKTYSALRIIKLDLADARMTTSMSHNGGNLAFLLLGLYFAIPSFSSIISHVVRIIYVEPRPNEGVFHETYLLSYWPKHIEDIIEFLAGVILIIGLTRWKQLWRRLRPLSDMIADPS
jgi:hypothetical protein